MVLVILIVLINNITVNGQFKKGMRMVGATVVSAFFNSGKTDYSYPPPTAGYTSNSNSFGITLNPSIGWFVSDNIAIGALLNVGYNHQKNFDENASGVTFNKNIFNSFNFGIGGFARNYFNSPGNLTPFGQFNLNAGIGSSSNNGFYFTNGDKNTYDGKSSGDFFINTGLALGLTKMFNANTGLDFYVGYSFSYNKKEFKTTTLTDVGNDGSTDLTSISDPTQKFTNHGIAIGIGFQVFLDKKK